ncbi:uncharacterized protein LTR77_003163 [Saxophila tyrrhenica]|uniref:Uncharacterized protein n=1 Tax=Saxophila tyrrhenica TaxID=1690608 RepID=A0AAV9PHK7_9PEZI|nr:hypothetical protein LTR77_003163 [Saxophila tyrrhenica]
MDPASQTSYQSQQQDFDIDEFITLQSQSHRHGKNDVDRAMADTVHVERLNENYFTTPALLRDHTLHHRHETPPQGAPQDIPQYFRGQGSQPTTLSTWTDTSTKPTPSLHRWNEHVSAEDPLAGLGLEEFMPEYTTKMDFTQDISADLTKLDQNALQQTPETAPGLSLGNSGPVMSSATPEPFRRGGQDSFLPAMDHYSSDSLDGAFC